jgi:hypothetical protein
MTSARNVYSRDFGLKGGWAAPTFIGLFAVPVIVKGYTAPGAFLARPEVPDFTLENSLHEGTTVIIL